MSGQEYVVWFTAINGVDLDGDEGARLGDAVRAMPGVHAVGDVEVEASTRTLRAGFAIPVEQAMAEAARDGGRLAKEMLMSARIPDARLVELVVRMVDPTP